MASFPFHRLYRPLGRLGQKAWRLVTLWRHSRLTRRVLVLNLLALVIPVGGILYLGEYRRGLIDAELKTLAAEANAIAGAIGAAAIETGPAQMYLHDLPGGMLDGAVFDGEAFPEEGSSPTPFPSPLPLPVIEPGAENLRSDLLLPDEDYIEGMDGSGYPRGLKLSTARALLERMVRDGQRARLFDLDGNLIADSRVLGINRREVKVADLPVESGMEGVFSGLAEFWGGLIDRVQLQENVLPYQEPAEQKAFHYLEARAALTGESQTGLRGESDGTGLVLLSATPIRQYKRVYGALLLTGSDQAIEEAVRHARAEVLKLFSVALVIALFLSSYLSGTIVRPILRLATAADQLRLGQGIGARRGISRPSARSNGRESRSGEASREVLIPDFSDRKDEIGDLSVALGEMTRALRERMDATERFAADVSHELKNPITSLQSALETLEKLMEADNRLTSASEDIDPEERLRARQKQAERKARLMAILHDDIHRLDRLITDIAAYSRLEGQMSREKVENIDLRDLLHRVIRSFREQLETGPRRVDMTLETGDRGEFLCAGVSDHLWRLFRNLGENALSFSSDGGEVLFRLTRVGGLARIQVQDSGPGIPDSKLSAVFERFYTSRPPGEKFGLHSGLGLSISREICEAHGGSIRASNRRDGDGNVCGACFTIDLPLLEEEY